MALPKSQVLIMYLFSITSRFLITLFACVLVQASLLTAQPSGGPYGPQAQDYPLPQLVDGQQLFIVAPDAEEGGQGSVESPMPLERAIELASSGDYIILRGGCYRTGDLQCNQGITLQPYRDEQPVGAVTFRSVAYFLGFLVSRKTGRLVGS